VLVVDLLDKVLVMLVVCGVVENGVEVMLLLSVVWLEVLLTVFVCGVVVLVALVD
jgi:hypothetical protein